MSFGLLEQDSLLSAALGNVSSKAFMVAAAGNDDINGLHFPAQRKSLTFAVTSTDAHDRKAQFANYNRDARVSAPGVGLFSAYPGGRWATWSGTSFSTALVTGEAALLYYLHPNLDRVTMNYILMYSGVNVDALNPGYAGLLGRVRIDFLEMVNRSLAFRRN
jgi:subtilisin family serine protease